MATRPSTRYNSRAPLLPSTAAAALIFRPRMNRSPPYAPPATQYSPQATQKRLAKILKMLMKCPRFGRPPTCRSDSTSLPAPAAATGRPGWGQGAGPTAVHLGQHKQHHNSGLHLGQHKHHHDGQDM
jgi:hypothetical protein